MDLGLFKIFCLIEVSFNAEERLRLKIHVACQAKVPIPSGRESYPRNRQKRA